MTETPVRRVTFNTRVKLWGVGETALSAKPGTVLTRVDDGAFRELRVERSGKKPVCVPWSNIGAYEAGDPPVTKLAKAKPKADE